MSLIEISPVEAAEFHLIIKEFLLIFDVLRTLIFSAVVYKIIVHHHKFLITAPITMGVGLIATYKEAWSIIDHLGDPLSIRQL